MAAWLNSHLTAWVYLIAATAATGVLLILWFTRTNHTTSKPPHLKHPIRQASSLRLCVSLVLATWTAVALRNEWSQSEPIPLLAAIVVFVLSWLSLTFAPLMWHEWRARQQKRVAKRCVGQVGKVYQSITSETGSVDIEQSSKRLRLPALSKTGEPLPAFCDVEVTGINDDGVLWVIRMS